MFTVMMFGFAVCCGLAGGAAYYMWKTKNRGLSVLLAAAACLSLLLGFVAAPWAKKHFEDGPAAAGAAMKPLILEPIPGIRVLKFRDEGEWQRVVIPPGFELSQDSAAAPAAEAPPPPLKPGESYSYGYSVTGPPADRRYMPLWIADNGKQTLLSFGELPAGGSAEAVLDGQHKPLVLPRGPAVVTLEGVYKTIVLSFPGAGNQVAVSKTGP